MADWQQYLNEHEAQFTEEMLGFLRIPSISGLSEHMPDIRRAAAWVADRATVAGMENVQILETGAHPLVYADWLHAPGKPTIAIYGHYDVQPVDPLDQWTSPPFEPVIKDDRVYARGANDDKGNMLIPILAVETLLQTEGALPVNLKFFFEGQEEIGSPNLAAFIAAHEEQLACDMVISSDGGQWAEDQPALMVGLRGLASVQIDVTGPSHDVHSGMYGGAIQNPIHALTEILASMRATDGTILIDGFYDDCVQLTPADREQIALVPYDEVDYKAAIDVDDLYGEPGYSTMERRWARPTLEVNGIWGGFQGEGVKTVIPSTAHAKISCRLVASQDPANIIEVIAAHVEKHSPAGVRVTVTPYESVAGAYLMPNDHPGNQAARDVHIQMYGKEPYYARSGGSIPFCTLILEALGVYTVNFAFALGDELQHSPNEFFRLSSFRHGLTAYCLLLARLGEE